MNKKILFICDPLANFKIATDTTYLMLTTAQDMGFEVFVTLPGEIYAENNIGIAITHKIKILATNKDIPGSILPWYQEDKEIYIKNLTEFRTIFVRNDPPFNMEYYYLTQIMYLAEQNGVKVVSNSNSLRNFNEKLSILNFPNLITPTTVTKNKQVIFDFLNKHNECVIKPLDLMAGRGVFKISPTEVNCNAIIETSTDYFTQTVMLQKFIPEVVHGDRRIFIVNGKVIEHCLYRIPQKNQIRGNLGAGGRGEVHPLTADDYKLANEVAVWLKAQGVVWAGIDVIGNKLTEINITSPTGARQIFAQTGINITQMVLESV
jgi:glutathione synthase